MLLLEKAMDPHHGGGSGSPPDSPRLGRLSEGGGGMRRSESEPTLALRETSLDARGLCRPGYTPNGLEVVANGFDVERPPSAGAETEERDGAVQAAGAADWVIEDPEADEGRASTTV